MKPTNAPKHFVRPQGGWRTATLMSLSAAATGAALLLTGCGGMANTALTAAQPGAAFKGSLHGGQQPVGGARIQLYAAQATGYGNASVPLLTVSPTSDANGNFGFAGFPCPAAPNDQVYLVATGGNPGAGPNANLAMMTALGSCSTITTSTFVNVDEITTVGAVYALSGFMTDYLHVASSPTNAVGLKNAFATVNNLVDYPSGTALAVTPGYSAANMPAGTTTATFKSTVPQAEINTLANILAACVNTNGVGGSSTLCSQLFTAAKPANGAAPTETIQAALNIAKFPGNNVSALFNLSSPNAPFAPVLTAAPNDWTIAINYIGGGLGGPGTPVAQDATSSDLAIDANGNIWISNLRTSKVTELNSVGAPLTTSTQLTGANAGTTGGYGGGGISNPNAIAIDQAGNAWLANTNSSISELTSNGSPIGTGFTGGGISGTAKGIAIDNTNNVWVASSVVSEYSNAGTPISPAAGYTSGINTPTGAIAIDSVSNVWVVNGGNATVVRLQNASGLPLYTSVPSLTSATSYGSIDATNQFLVPQGSPNSNLEIFNVNAQFPTTITPASASNVVSTSVDGVGNIWLVNAGGALGIAANVTQLTSTGAVLSTPGTGYQGTGSNLIQSPRGSGLDQAGNLWISNGISVSTVTEFVGIGAPTIAPLVAASTTGKIGTRP